MKIVLKGVKTADENYIGSHAVVPAREAHTPEVLMGSL